MTQEHPITPLPELVEQWKDEWENYTTCGPNRLVYVATAAARWGADQELEACCEWVDSFQDKFVHAHDLRLVRRPKPPSLKEQALEVFDKLEHLFDGYGHDGPTIRRALEALPD